MGFKFTEEVTSVDRASTQEDFRTAMGMITAMICKDRSPDEVMMAISCALAIVTTLFSPTEEIAKGNRERIAKFVAATGDDMWKYRDDVEKELVEKVDRLTPMAIIHDMAVAAMKENKKQKESEAN